MSVPESRRRTGVLTSRLRAVVRGPNDSGVRATWRVLLAMPVLWVLTGAVLAGNVQTAIPWIPTGQGPTAGLAQSLLHAGFFLVALAGWARYLDARPLSDYGVSATPAWLLDLVAGFGAVVVGFVVWLGLGAALGGVTVTTALSSPQDSLGPGLVVVAVALLLHAAVQQLVFFRVALGSAAEGLKSRDLSRSLPFAGALAVAVVLFVAMHGSVTPLRVLDLIVAGCVFGLLSLHTGELALGIGAHLGALYGGNVLFGPASSAEAGSAVFQVTGSLPGLLGSINRYGFPKMVVAYLALLAWVQWRRGEITVGNGTVQSAGE
jgi:hypothetical protein